RSITAHGEGINDVVITPDGKRLFTASSDGTTRIWESSNGEELVRLVSLNEGKDWLVITPDGHFDGSPNAFKLAKFRTDGRLKLEPIEKHANELHRPGLLAAIWKDEKLPEQ